MSYIKLSDLEERELIPGFKVRFIHSEKMTLAYWKITAGSLLPEHSHTHEQVATVVEGEIEFTINKEKQILRPGQVAVIPSGTLHSGKAITDCQIIDAFSPVREDYKSNIDLNNEE